MADDPWAAFRIPEPEQPAATAALPPAQDEEVRPPISQPDIWASFRGQPTVNPVDVIPGTRGPDKYQQAAIDERNKAIQRGDPNLEGYTDKAAYGTGLGWGDELMAGMLTPLEMVKRGVGPVEGYNYAKAQQNLTTQNQPTDTAGTLAGVTGSLATGAGAFGGARAAAAPIYGNLSKEAAPFYNYGRNILKAGGIGAAAGSGEGDTFEQRFEGAKMGGLLGLGLGAGIPAVGAVVGLGGRIMQTPRLYSGETLASEQVSKAVQDSGQTLTQLLAKVNNAQAAGQTDYTLADAIGKEGERKLAAQAKTPGPARERITEALESRMTNRPYNVSDEIGQALGAPESAAKATDRLINQAQTEAAPLYQKAEQAGPVWNNAMQEIFNTPEAKAGLAEGVNIQRIRSAGTKEPFNPTDAAITGFNEAGDPILSGVPNMKTINTLKIGLDAQIAKETDVTGRMTNRGAALVGMKNRLLDQVDAMNPAYAEARTAFRGPMEVKDAVQTGRDMASRGRAADTVPAFQGMPAPEQQGVRIGYADKVLEQLERTGNIPGILRGKSVKGSNELDALSLYQGPRQIDPATGRPRPDQFRQYMDRVEEMQKTEKAALGGSSTAENLADITSAPGGGEAIGAAGNVAQGNIWGAARNLGELGLRIGKGESEKQRNAIAQMLLSKEPDEMSKVMTQLEQANQRRRGYNPWTGTYRFPEGQQ